MAISHRQIGQSQEANLIYNLSKQLHNLTFIISTGLAAVNTDLSLKANDNNVVHLTGNENISGVKTFNDNVILNYKSLKITGVDTNGDNQEVFFGINSEGNPEWSTTDVNGEKVTIDFNIDNGFNFNKKANFLGTITASPATQSTEVVTKSQLDLKANDTDVVKLTGNQTINGFKIFSSSIEFQNTITFRFNFGSVSGGFEPRLQRAGDHIGVVSTADSGVAALNTKLITGPVKVFTFPNQSGTLALTNNPTSLTATDFRLSNLNIAPASATSTGTTGEIRITAGFIYVCIATNTWVRTALATW